MPKGHRIAHVRLDSAGYQVSIFNYCEDTGKTFAIGAPLDAPKQKVIAGIPESAWKHYADCAVAETLHSMNGTKNVFRLIVVKHKRQVELFDDKPKYHAIASNRIESPEATLIWYRQCGEISENGIKELKIGFGMERMPCGQFKANAAFFRIGVIAHNLFVLFKQPVLGADWQRHKVATVRWRLFHLPGKVVRHAGAWVLKVASDAVKLFRSIRTRRALRWRNRCPRSDAAPCVGNDTSHTDVPGSFRPAFVKSAISRRDHCFCQGLITQQALLPPIPPAKTPKIPSSAA